MGLRDQTRSTYTKCPLFNSDPQSDTHAETKTIWFFSDMVNEPRALLMPALIGTGSEPMLDRANANRLLVPLKDYQIHIQGASPRGLSPQACIAIKKFWELYFAAAGAELVSYSVDCNVKR